MSSPGVLASSSINSAFRLPSAEGGVCVISTSVPFSGADSWDVAAASPLAASEDGSAAGALRPNSLSFRTAAALLFAVFASVTF